MFFPLVPLFGPKTIVQDKFLAPTFSASMAHRACSQSEVGVSSSSLRGGITISGDEW